MVAHHLVESLHNDRGTQWSVDVFGEEDVLPYDRVALTSLFTDASVDSLALGDPALWDDDRVNLHRGHRVDAIDRAHQFVVVDGKRVPYDALVLATGSSVRIPPIAGIGLPGCFTYRTVQDVHDVRAWVDSQRHNSAESPRGVVIGGGLLGLEAAGALNALGVQAEVIEFADRLMPAQLDHGGAEALSNLVDQLGITVRTSARVDSIRQLDNADNLAVGLAGGETIKADIVIAVTGIQPRDELARAAGISVHEDGGVLVDAACMTSDRSIFAIGEVARIDGQVWGLVGPGKAMADTVVSQLSGQDAAFGGADGSTKLKLLGADVASFGDAHGTTEKCLSVVYADPVAGVYKKLVVTDDAKTLLGGILVGDASAYASLRPRVGLALGDDPNVWLLPSGEGRAGTNSDLPDSAPVCTCNSVSVRDIRDSVCEVGCTNLAEVKACTKAGTSCGSCLPLVKEIMGNELAQHGIELSRSLCEHFDVTRAQLFDIVRVTGIRTFSEIIERHGRGRGCDICRPVLASILSSLGDGHVLDPDVARLQDTNDHAMANIQKDGTYSVVPRIPGGEITPDGLLVIAQVAKDFALYTKITGGQRIDMFGARLDQLPAIWARLVEAGFESGQAYGKAVRTVKSCVGLSWCRYGVQDSVGLAVALELRYRGLRSPHKIKLGVSGCARECAEARSKDVGVIATDQGWNLYVGGNGGFTPRHAQLFAEGLSTDELVGAIDRFLMYYVRTADRLQRTASWIESIDGGLEEIARVVLEDSLGIGADLDLAMSRHIESYEDEWAQTLKDPVKLSHFVSFVNEPQTSDPTLAYVFERGQRRPATADERAAGVLVAGPTLEVRS